ncbi:uncharacterized protein L201_001416 [Kwoniella dendrophila CBS 6074]|uniref:monoamine oxidase n=1 Tax=Kwoniella dendrophila CBS 6074 TaxID=1295534 RepID=A0AAX4JNQ6_9TREE
MKVAIIGGGLSGLYAGMLLERAGIKDYMIFEAQGKLGGRTPSINLEWVNQNTNQTISVEHFDLGGTWHWPSSQPELVKVIKELNLQTYEQYQMGDALFEMSKGQPVERFGNDGGGGNDDFRRIAGGMNSLIQAFSKNINSSRILLNHHVNKLEYSNSIIEITTKDAEGKEEKYQAEKVLLALPPRLVVRTIEFEPDLPEKLRLSWLNTNTWMASHAKYLAVYDKPFWRNKGLSGNAFSRIGPLGEINDASSHNGESAALFGFFSLPANIRKNIPHNQLLNSCREQMIRLFGKEAADVKVDMIKDWSSNTYTATEEDLLPPKGHGHGRAPPNIPDDGDWKNRLVGIGSEWSLKYPGFIAGAIDAAQHGIDNYLRESDKSRKVEL